MIVNRSEGGSNVSGTGARDRRRTILGADQSMARSRDRHEKLAIAHRAAVLVRGRPPPTTERLSPDGTEERTVSDNTYRVIDIVGTSTTDISDGVRNGIAHPSDTVDELDWFGVTGTRGHIANGQVAHFQVYLEVGFELV